MSRNQGSKTTREGAGLTPDPFGALAKLGNLPAGPGDPQDCAAVIPVKTSQRGLRPLSHTAHKFLANGSDSCEVWGTPAL